MIRALEENQKPGEYPQLLEAFLLYQNGDRTVMVLFQGKFLALMVLVKESLLQRRQ